MVSEFYRIVLPNVGVGTQKITLMNNLTRDLQIVIKEEQTKWLNYVFFYVLSLQTWLQYARGLTPQHKKDMIVKVAVQTQ